MYPITLNIYVGLLLCDSSDFQINATGKQIKQMAMCILSKNFRPSEYAILFPLQAALKDKDPRVMALTLQIYTNLPDSVSLGDLIKPLVFITSQVIAGKLPAGK